MAGPVGEFLGVGPAGLVADEAMNYLRWLVQIPREITGIGLRSFLSNLSFEVDFRLGDPTKGFGFNVDFNWTERGNGTGGTAATGLALVLYEQIWPGRQVQF
jgi:hypothetical protein